MNKSHAQFQVKIFNCDSYENSVHTSGTIFVHRCSHLFLFFSPVWMEDVEDFFHTCSLSVKKELKDIWVYVQRTGKRLVILHNTCFAHASQSNAVQQLAWGLVQPVNCFWLAAISQGRDRGCRGHKYFLHSQNSPFRPSVCSTQTWELSFHQMSSRDAQREGRRDHLSSAHMALPWAARVCHQHQRCSCSRINNLVQECTFEANLLFIHLAVWLAQGRVLEGYKLGSFGLN